MILLFRLKETFVCILAAVLNIININCITDYFKDAVISSAKQFIPEFGINRCLGYINRTAFWAVLKKYKGFFQFQIKSLCRRNTDSCKKFNV